MNDPTNSTQSPPTAEQMELAQSLLMYAVDAVISINGNSYVNACTEQWLEHASSLGVYPKDGPFIGNVEDVRNAWEDWLEDHEGLPEWPETPGYLARIEKLKQN